MERDNPINKIKHDIRNMKELTSKQLYLIKNMTSNEKNEIINLYNEMMCHVNLIINDDFYHK